MHAQATARSTAREEVAKQLALWQDAGFASHMDAGRMLIYELLAGHVNHVVPQMQLDWRRAFALHLWYTFVSCICLLMWCVPFLRLSSFVLALPSIFPQGKVSARTLNWGTLGSATTQGCFQTTRTA